MSAFRLLQSAFRADADDSPPNRSFAVISMYIVDCPAPCAPDLFGGEHSIESRAFVGHPRRPGSAIHFGPIIVMAKRPPIRELIPCELHPIFKRRGRKSGHRQIGLMRHRNRGDIALRTEPVDSIDIDAQVAFQSPTGIAVVLRVRIAKTRAGDIVERGKDAVRGIPILDDHLKMIEKRISFDIVRPRKFKVGAIPFGTAPGCRQKIGNGIRGIDIDYELSRRKG